MLIVLSVVLCFATYTFTLYWTEFAPVLLPSDLTAVLPPSKPSFTFFTFKTRVVYWRPQVTCVPWGTFGSNVSSPLDDASVDGNDTVVPTSCPNMAYALLSCVAGTVTLVPYLHVSSFPKTILLVLLSVTYTIIMETSGYRQAVGWDGSAPHVIPYMMLLVTCWSSDATKQDQV